MKGDDQEKRGSGTRALDSVAAGGEEGLGVSTARSPSHAGLVS